ncbi:unnamed protein product [Ilex paraguariensis]|uniref:Bulb-type lectin domain-containing protein n=1 Tax=Ilex paraguariensis TaxID=185542 RepID=A0ABC8S9A2_9AQUA
MKLFLFVFLCILYTYGYCGSDVHIGYRVILAVPMSYSRNFTGRAFLMETAQMAPKFRAALSVEAVEQKYSCSLDVFLGDVKVWSSGHLSKFYTTEKCVIQLTRDGDLQLTGQKDSVGWRSGTSGQGVERLHLLRTGNLVLVDGLNLIKWQSFNFPTDIMLWGQRLSSETRLTSFPSNSSLFYSFEIQHDKIALYLNSGKRKYSYWEYKPSKDRNLTFVELASKGIELYSDKHSRIGQITSQRLEPLRFLALGTNTGNLGLYYYSPDKGNFEASFQAINTTCDLPLACKPYGICTFSNACSCIRLITRGEGLNSDCDEGISEGFCGRNQADMLELQSVSSVLRGIPQGLNISKKVCAGLCIEDCNCVAALYSSGTGDSSLQECFLYGMVRGLKQVNRGSGLSYMVKFPKETSKDHGKSSGLKKWVLVVVGVVDGLIILLVLGGIGYYVVQKRRRNTSDTRNPT